MTQIRHSLTRIYQAAGKYEPAFFYLLLLINTLPVLLFKNFPTVDGPAHLYNTRLILDLLQNPDSGLSDFLMFNPHLNPNLIGHVLLGAFMLFLPALVAEKVVLLVYLILFPVAFRYLLSVLRIKETWLVYFVFPFTYSFMFFYGFYNFHLGLVFFFFTLGFWIRTMQKGFSWRVCIGLALLSMMVFFSHLFVFAMLLLTIGIINMSAVSDLLSNNSVHRKAVFNTWLRQLLILLPGIILTIIYFVTHPPGNGVSEYTSWSEIWLMIKHVQPAKGVDYIKEDIFTKWIFFLFVLITGYHLINRIRKLKKPVTRQSFIWGILVVLLFLALKLVPNTVGGNFGFVSSRLLVFFFLFLIVFLATLRTPLWLKIIAFVIINYANIGLLNVYVHATEKNSAIVEQVIAASALIEPYSTVYPIYSSNDWLFTHVSNYLGIDTPMIITKNYEASLDYFPLKWNYAQLPNLRVSDSPNDTRILYTENPDQHQQIDYVFIFSEDSNNPNETLDSYPFLNQNYTLVYKSENQRASLFRKKESVN